MYFHCFSYYDMVPGITNLPIRVRHLGITDYPDAIAVLNECAERRTKNIISDTLLILEHPPTYTMGMRARKEHLLVSEETLQNSNIPLFRVDRGGDITFHGPGQLVGYPVLDVKFRKLDIRQYVNKLETVIIRTLADFGVTAHRNKGFPGVWLDDAKIAAVGVKINAAGVSSHGIAININTDLSFFQNIVPCGLADANVTSLAEIAGHPIEMDNVRQVFANAFLSEFER